MCFQIKMVRAQTFEVDLVTFFLMCSVSLFPAKEELFPVADATAFFTDLHHVLKVIAAGNMRTLCHRRLVLLEQVRVLVTEELISNNHVSSG